MRKKIKKQTNFYPDPSRKKKKEQAQIDKIKNEKEKQYCNKFSK